MALVCNSAFAEMPLLVLCSLYAFVVGDGAATLSIVLLVMSILSHAVLVVTTLFYMDGRYQVFAGHNGANNAGGQNVV